MRKTVHHVSSLYTQEELPYNNHSWLTVRQKKTLIGNVKSVYCFIYFLIEAFISHSFIQLKIPERPCCLIAMTITFSIRYSFHRICTLFDIKHHFHTNDTSSNHKYEPIYVFLNNLLFIFKFLYIMI